MSELYQTSLSLLKVEKTNKSLLIKLKYLVKISSLSKSTQNVRKQEKITISKLHYSHKNYSENRKISLKCLK